MVAEGGAGRKRPAARGDKLVRKGSEAKGHVVRNHRQGGGRRVRALLANALALRGGLPAVLRPFDGRGARVEAPEEAPFLWRPPRLDERNSPQGKGKGSGTWGLAATPAPIFLFGAIGRADGFRLSIRNLAKAACVGPKLRGVGFGTFDGGNRRPRGRTRR